MTEHWSMPDDAHHDPDHSHHDAADHHAGDHPFEVPDGDDLHHLDHDTAHEWADPGVDDHPQSHHDAAEPHEPPPEHAAVDPDPAYASPGVGPVGVNPDAVGEQLFDPDVFPPALHVDALPEPADGFPWIDTGSLGVGDPAVPAAEPPVPAAELAEYAATDLPPGVDPWAALAASDDPAVSALARWWAQPDAQ